MVEEKNEATTEVPTLDVGGLKKDLTQLQQQSVAISGAIQYISQKIAQLEKKQQDT